MLRKGHIEPFFAWIKFYFYRSEFLDEMRIGSA